MALMALQPPKTLPRGHSETLQGGQEPDHGRCARAPPRPNEGLLASVAGGRRGRPVRSADRLVCCGLGSVRSFQSRSLR